VSVMMNLALGFQRYKEIEFFIFYFKIGLGIFADYWNIRIRFLLAVLVVFLACLKVFFLLILIFNPVKRMN
jgi:hypothetical protein